MWNQHYLLHSLQLSPRKHSKTSPVMLFFTSDFQEHQVLFKITAADRGMFEVSENLGIAEFAAIFLVSAGSHCLPTSSHYALEL